MEARNDHLKNIFKFFGNTISTSYIPNLGNFLRIAGAIINKYYGIITMHDADIDLVEEMLDRAEEVNVIQARVEAHLSSI